MDEELPIHPFSAKMACGLIVAVIMLYAFVSKTNQTPKQIHPIDEKPLISEVIPHPSQTPKEPAVNPDNRSKTKPYKKIKCFYHPVILQAANHHQVDPDLVKAIIMAESSYNPMAISERGAKGLMQLMPKTAEALGVEDSFNPEQNIKGGVKYFKQLVDQFDGDVKLALAAYNAGSRNVIEYQGIPPFKATQYYIQKVFKYYQLYKNQPSGDMEKA